MLSWYYIVPLPRMGIYLYTDKKVNKTAAHLKERNLILSSITRNRRPHPPASGIISDHGLCPASSASTWWRKLSAWTQPVASSSEPLLSASPVQHRLHLHLQRVTTARIQGYFYRPVTPNRRPPVPVYR
jgi:hypothetical protein